MSPLSGVMPAPRLVLIFPSRTRPCPCPALVDRVFVLLAAPRSLQESAEWCVSAPSIRSFVPRDLVRACGLPSHDRCCSFDESVAASVSDVSRRRRDVRQCRWYHWASHALSFKTKTATASLACSVMRPDDGRFVYGGAHASFGVSTNASTRFQPAPDPAPLPLNTPTVPPLPACLAFRVTPFTGRPVESHKFRGRPHFPFI